MDICSVNSCERKVRSSGIGLCGGHETRWRNTGHINPDKPFTKSRVGGCTVENCLKPIRAIGLCAAHESRQRMHGDVLSSIPVKPIDRTIRVCAAEGCELRASGKYCPKHYVMWKRHGDPLYKLKNLGTVSAEGYRRV